MSTPEPDILRRGQAIFDRLRGASSEDPPVEPDTAAVAEPDADVAGPSEPIIEEAPPPPVEPLETDSDGSAGVSTESVPTEPLESPSEVTDESQTREVPAQSASDVLAEPLAPAPDPPTMAQIVSEAAANMAPSEPAQQPTDAPADQRSEWVRAAHPASLRSLPRVIAIANQKGGVGKTTTTVNLGAGLAELGYRVLIIDLDPQGNATTGLGVNPRNLECSIYDVLLHDVALDDCIEPTAVRNLFVAPATIDLAGADIELVPAFSRELRLRRAIEALDDSFDFTIIDCPPSLGLITVNGLAAASEVIVPIQCEYYALEGLGQLLKNVNLVTGNLNPKLEISAIVLTMYDSRTKLAEQVAQEVREHFGEKVCRMVIPRTVRLSEAPSFGQPILTFDPTSRGAVAYRELAKEVSGGGSR
jgi:chromosome partitioning protein